MPSGAADPIGQGRAVEINALPGIDLRLPIQRQVIGVLGHQDLGDRRLGWQSTFDQSRRCGCLHYALLASPAGVLGPAHDQHAELRWDDVEPFTHVLADPVQHIAAARAGMILDVDYHLDARQVRWKRSTVRAPLGSTTAPFGGIAGFGLGLAVCCCLLDVFQPEQQLIFRQRLGPAAEAMTL